MLIWGTTTEEGGVAAVVQNFTATAIIIEIDDYAGAFLLTLLSNYCDYDIASYS
eukprot:CAMPEP_0170551162 /NCGR_PEP_ID=MMETSP0211-20121228/9193_1 /TAXON_ID=311385 /ORGANISM="Pseudokeronopsis sp., Strain OXSARD2" /LENGTH=53 /DNA_ID=CAMNT_0010858163 /DNA_START=1167 /DNA_END=1328 /DNA_ORIENTATION=-